MEKKVREKKKKLEEKERLRHRGDTKTRIRRLARRRGESAKEERSCFAAKAEKKQKSVGK